MDVFIARCLKSNCKSFIIFIVLTLSPAIGFASDGTGIGLGFRAMQKIWQGISEPTRYVQCRLTSRKVIKNKQICVYRGANSTFLAIYNDRGGFCSKEIQCRYDPDKDQSAAALVAAFTKAEAKRTKD